MFLRAYLIPRYIRDHSFLFRRGSQFIGALSDVEFSNLFVLKTILDAHPYSVVAGLLSTLVAVLSYIVHIAERIDNPQHAQFGDSIWFLGITLVTVGYGDIVVTTLSGRISAFVTALIGLLLTALLVALVQRRLALSLQEAKVVTFLRRDRSRRLVAPSAAVVIQKAWAYSRARRAVKARPSFRARRAVRTAERTMYAALRTWRKLKHSLSSMNTKTEADYAAIFEEIFIELLDLHADVNYLLERLRLRSGISSSGLAATRTSSVLNTSSPLAPTKSASMADLVRATDAKLAADSRALRLSFTGLPSGPRLVDATEAYSESVDSCSADNTGDADTSGLSGNSSCERACPRSRSRSHSHSRRSRASHSASAPGIGVPATPRTEPEITTATLTATAANNLERVSTIRGASMLNASTSSAGTDRQPPPGQPSLLHWAQQDYPHEKSAAISRLEYEIARQGAMLRSMSFRSFKSADKTGYKRRKHLLRRLDPSSTAAISALSLDDDSSPCSSPRPRANSTSSRPRDHSVSFRLPHESYADSAAAASRTDVSDRIDALTAATSALMEEDSAALNSLQREVASLELKVDAQFSSINAALAILLERSAGPATAPPPSSHPLRGVSHATGSPYAAGSRPRGSRPRAPRGRTHPRNRPHPPSAMPEPAPGLDGLTPIMPPLPGRTPTHRKR
ncbi:potassium channel TSK2 [Thecamonas trahens ATCC 50062]|uniref:Potassium channel TSK2 n=1 Tax=Thecamonas trahens ATCC 50062 TaxID=461836 RepID=A0A0L0DGC0_THETB|nr:potassium channel TSK2 [Thecamonas trahens ATCC 50062]KNC51379.1 potassium channel TSK2 [Thecamonas trahens ATCC 50062]|eukprot:XP_013756047.1 potassium channel TSK2 [Thecamonas trahens ATCC 50062]